MRKAKSKIMIILAVLTVVGFGSFAFADGGMGYGNHRGMGNHGSNWNKGGSGCPGYGNMMGDLSEEKVQKIDEQRKAFFNATQGLRQKIYRKQLALQSEFAKDKPDSGKAAGLQKEISQLRARIDQKKVKHMIEMRKINPNAGTGFRGRGHMMGFGSSGDGSCWR